jgi:hypothetical protein
MPRLIIGITGHKRHGKDTISDHLATKYGFVKESFAGPLKEICRTLFGFDDRQLHGDQKEVIDPNWKVTPRTVLQYVGTELFRKQMGKIIPNLEERFWVRCMDQKLQGYPDDTKIVLSDVRFPDEAKLVDILFAVQRPSCKTEDMHDSERFIDELAKLPGTIIVQNDSDVPALLAKIDAILASPVCVHKPDGNLIALCAKKHSAMQDEDDNPIADVDPVLLDYAIVYKGKALGVNYQVMRFFCKYGGFHAAQPEAKELKINAPLGPLGDMEIFLRMVHRPAIFMDGGLSICEAVSVHQIAAYFGYAELQTACEETVLRLGDPEFDDIDTVVGLLRMAVRLGNGPVYCFIMAFFFEEARCCPYPQRSWLAKILDKKSERDSCCKFLADLARCIAAIQVEHIPTALEFNPRVTKVGKMIQCVLKAPEGTFYNLNTKKTQNVAEDIEMGSDDDE